MSLFLDVFAGKEGKRRPVWLMRQAGRYLPEYQDIRQRHSLFSCFHEPELAEQITWMPLKRFPLDAAILFSDLLVIAEVWGKKVVYPETGAPFITPSVREAKEIFVPSEEEIQEKLSYVLMTISRLKPKLSVPLIGFCGAPFTLACYLLGFDQVKCWMRDRNEEFCFLLDQISKTCILYAQKQIEFGVQAFQLFDSWADQLSSEEFELFVLPYLREMKQALDPLKIPLLFYSRASSSYPEKISSVCPDGISFDEKQPLAFLRQQVPADIVVQGNFSPSLLQQGSVAEIKKEARSMVESVAAHKRIIWNLGHGVLPNTPLENVVTFLEALD